MSGDNPRYGFHRDYLSDPSALSYYKSLPLTSDFNGKSGTSSSLPSDSTAAIPSTCIEPESKTVPSYLIGELGGCWQFCNINGPFPENMIRAGVDADGAAIFVGRAFHEGEMIPAKVIPSKNVAFVCYGGEEILKEEFEVLRYGAFVWEYASNGSVPETALKIGQSADGEPLYMGRAIHNGTQTPGKVHCSHGCCYLPFEGEEISVTDYEVLCVR